MDAKVYSVQSVHFHINKSKPPQLVINAAGEASTSGWSNGRLIPWVYIAKPADGIQDFDFIATAPSGTVLEVLTPISGNCTVFLDEWMKGIRVHASSNEVEVRLDDTACLVEPHIAPVLAYGGGAGSEFGSSEGIGYSNSMSFDEAFQDALKNLPTNSGNYPDELNYFTVSSISAEIGGIAGLQRMRVVVRGSNGKMQHR